MGKKKSNPAQQAVAEAQSAYKNTQQPSQTENAMSGFTSGLANNYNQASQQGFKDYGNIMGGYQNFMGNLGAPKQFSFQHVNATTPEELTKAYGYLDEAMPGYRDFASTGGYSAADIRDLRARGISPIRAAYGNTMRQLDRARALGGDAGSPNYIAAVSRAQRELPEQLADSMTNVNAGLAESIRQGKEFGLTGISGTGSTMGGLASQDAQRQLSASLANQQADLQAQSLTEQALESNRQAQLAGLGGMTSLYGTTPGMANMFGEQALRGYGEMGQMENARNQLGADYLRMQMTNPLANKQGTPWWRKALGAAAAGAATYFTGGALGPAAGSIYGAVAGGDGNDPLGQAAGGLGGYFGGLGGGLGKIPVTSGLGNWGTGAGGAFTGMGQNIGLPTGDYGYGGSQQYWD